MSRDPERERCHRRLRRHLPVPTAEQAEIAPDELGAFRAWQQQHTEAKARRSPSSPAGIFLNF